VDALDWDAVAERVTEIDREQCLVPGFVEMGLYEDQKMPPAEFESASPP
jgi:hypothetical protein